MPERRAPLLLVTLGLGLAAAHARPAVAAGPPTVTAPCALGDANEELTSDGHVPVACWGAACIAYGEHGPERVSRPPVAAPVIAPATVGDAQICTGARCTPLGPHARAAIAKARAAGTDGLELSATADHAILVIERQADAYQLALWNVARDRPLPLPGRSTHLGGQEMHELTGAVALDDRVLVARSCNEWCDADGYLVDAAGRVRDTMNASGELSSAVHVLDPHSFLIVSAMGWLTWIDHGAVVARAYLFGGDFRPRDPNLDWARIDADTLAVQSCGHAGCAIGTVRLSRSDGFGDRPHLEIELDDALLPSCIDTNGRRLP